MVTASDASGWLAPEALLARHAARAPSRSAIVDVDSGERISRSELQQVVDGVAAQLAERGVGRGTRVVLLIDSGIGTVVTWLALWRVAAVVCPFDISQIGAASTSEAFDLLGPALVLHGPRIGALDLMAVAGSVPCARFGHWPPAAGEVADIRLTPLSQGAPAIGAGAGADDVAAACCTSGSAGHIKVVLHDHASYALNGIASRWLLGLREDDHLLDYRSLSWYSPQILSLMPMLQLGLTLHLARQFSASRFPDWVERYGIHVAAGVPTVLNILLQQPAQRLHDAIGGLRAMTSSSAPLTGGAWERFEQAFDVPILNLYGSSECGWICGNRLEDRRTGTVGRPVPGVRVDVVDATGRPCAPGEPGEIVVDSPKLAVGILQPDGTLRRVRGAPFPTRDLGLHDGDGFVRLLGRLDDLTIRGGVKISPSEIEDVMLVHHDVVEAAAVGVPDPIYGQEAVCFVVLRAGAEADRAALIAHAHARLPREKRPKTVWVMDALPHNARGKIRRDALRAHWRDVLGDADRQP